MIVNMNGGLTGAELTVTAPAGATVTVSKDGKVKTKVAGADGVAVFNGLTTGDWTLTITDGEQTAQKTVTITADYATSITFFSATIHITYPAGSTCTATDGVTTLTAPDTSGTWDCVVPNAGTWTVSLDSGFTETIDIVGSGEEHTLDTWHLFRNGDDLTNVTGGWSNSGWVHMNSACGSVTNNNGRINFASMSNGWNGGGTVNKIPIDGFKTITLSGLSGTYSSDYWSGIGICSSKNTDSAIACAKIQADNTTNLTLDVSNVSGSYYIAIMRWFYATEVVLKC